MRVRQYFYVQRILAHWIEIFVLIKPCGFFLTNVYGEGWDFKVDTS
jgi:hypothetical protein